MKSFEPRRALRDVTRTLAAFALTVGSVLGSALAFGADTASAEASTWGPRIGAELPVIEARDASGELRRLDDLAGENGLLLVFSRSVDW